MYNLFSNGIKLYVICKITSIALNKTSPRKNITSDTNTNVYGNLMKRRNVDDILTKFAKSER